MTFWKFMEFRAAEALIGLAVVLAVILIAALIGWAIEKKHRKNPTDD